MEFPLRRVQIPQGNFVKQVLVWLCVFWFRMIWFGTSYENLGQPHKFKLQL